jgi:CheY-like chemotaxis protein
MEELQPMSDSQYSESRPLVVWADDQPEALEAHRQCLDEAGFAVVTAASGTDALALLDENHASVLVADIRMPPGECGGVWLVENVRGGLKYDIPIIVLSGQGSRADAAKAMKAGATDFVDKESAPEELRAAVIQAHNSEKAEAESRAMRQFAEELAAFEVLLRSRLKDEYVKFFGAKHRTQLLDDIGGTLDAEGLTDFQTRTKSSDNPDVVLGQCFLMTLRELVLLRWNVLAGSFRRRKMDKPAFSDGYQHLNKQRNTLAHHRRSPELEIQRARVFMYDVTRALLG